MKKRFIIPFLIVITFISFSSSCKKDDTGDGTVPEIIVLGLNPLYWAVDIPYEDSGAIAFDISTTGDTTIITNKIVMNSNVDVSTTGDYVVTYNVTDDSGMSAEEKTRDVKVVIGK